MDRLKSVIGSRAVHDAGMWDHHAVEDHDVGCHLIQQVLCLLTLTALVGAIRTGGNAFVETAGDRLGNGIRLLRIDQDVRTHLDQEHEEEQRCDTATDVLFSSCKTVEPFHEQNTIYDRLWL